MGGNWQHWVTQLGESNCRYWEKKKGFVTIANHTIKNHYKSDWWWRRQRWWWWMGVCGCGCGCGSDEFFTFSLCFRQDSLYIMLGWDIDIHTINFQYSEWNEWTLTTLVTLSGENTCFSTRNGWHCSSLGTVCPMSIYIIHILLWFGNGRFYSHPSGLLQWLSGRL